MAYIYQDKILDISSIIIVVASALIISAFTIHSFLVVKKVNISLSDHSESRDGLPRSPVSNELELEEDEEEQTLVSPDSFSIIAIYEKIQSGAITFLATEYTHFLPILGVFMGVIIAVVTKSSGIRGGAIAGLVFLFGAFTSMMVGGVGMLVATYANARTTVSSERSLQKGFHTAFVAAQACGFFLPMVATLAIFSVLRIVRLSVPDWPTTIRVTSPFALAASTFGIFSRVSGGIFTKAADVGADMVGKVEENLAEDDPRNPAVIADNVGDNVGDIAGMYADLYGSIAEVTYSALINVSHHPRLRDFTTPKMFPLVFFSVANLVCMATTFATQIFPPKKKEDVESCLKTQILLSSFLMIPASLLVTCVFLPREQSVGLGMSLPLCVSAFLCITIGVLGSCGIGLATEYYTSSSHRPVRELSEASDTGAATVIIYGLSLGQRSTFAPVLLMGVMMYCSFALADFFGVVMMTLGLVSTTPIILTIDSYGPICDNAGGIAEMAGLSAHVRANTDVLDSAGNTTAAIGKGVSVMSAFAVGISLLTSFVHISQLEIVNILNAFPLFGLSFGAAYPMIFSSILNKSVGEAAMKMVKEVREQFRDGKILRGEKEPDYEGCVRVATKASLSRSFFPLLLTLVPVPIGVLLGKKALSGFIVGVQISGVPVAIAANNSGGAWDNAKKHIEAGGLGEARGKGSANHKAAVIGDTVGDPMKDTSGPSINTLMKIVAILSIVFNGLFPDQSLFEKL